MATEEPLYTTSILCGPDAALGTPVSPTAQIPRLAPPRRVAYAPFVADLKRLALELGHVFPDAVFEHVVKSLDYKAWKRDMVSQGVEAKAFERLVLPLLQERMEWQAAADARFREAADELARTYFERAPKGQE